MVLISYFQISYFYLQNSTEIYSWSLLELRPITNYHREIIFQLSQSKLSPSKDTISLHRDVKQQ